jgi:uncharacterized protein YcbK (DUF882 family)
MQRATSERQRAWKMKTYTCDVCGGGIGTVLRHGMVHVD